MSDLLMRSHMHIVEDFERCLRQYDVREEPPDEEATPSEERLISELEEAIGKMRSYTENRGGEYALGVEDGMQKAADILENLIRRYREGVVIG